MNDVHTITSQDGLRRVVVSLNSDGTFGFREEAFITEPPFHPDPFWTSRLWPDPHCDTLETAIQEALARVRWPPQLSTSTS